MKAITKIIAVAIAALGVATVAGCSGAAPSAKTATNANWNARTSASVEKNFTERWLNNREVAEYSISFTEGYNGTYTLNYGDDGVFKTEFGMTYYDWSAQKDLPDGYAPAGTTKELVYFYITEMSISGEFKVGENVKAFKDSVSTVCYYRLAGDNLQPVYSQQVIKNTAPNTLNAPILEAAYIEIDGVYTTYYKADCTKATVVHKNNRLTSDDTTTIETGLTSSEGYSVFDNSQLRAAVRAFNISSSATHTFNVLVPQNGAMQSVHATCTAPVALNKEDEGQMQIIKALDECSANHPDYLFFDKSAGEEEKAYRFNAVSMGINTSTNNMTGASPTFWYSTVENSEINSTKCVLLRMSTPISFGLGTLNYTLKSLSLQPNAN